MSLLTSAVLLSSLLGPQLASADGRSRGFHACPVHRESGPGPASITWSPRAHGGGVGLWLGVLVSSRLVSCAVSVSATVTRFNHRLDPFSLAAIWPETAGFDFCEIRWWTRRCGSAAAAQPEQPPLPWAAAYSCAISRGSGRWTWGR